MKLISLKKLLGKGEVIALFQELAGELGADISVVDRNEKLLLGTAVPLPDQRQPIVYAGETLGWVGGEKAPLLARVLTHMAGLEMEKKSLSTETLDKYKEINFLYDFSEKMSTCLELHEITALVADEAQKLIQADSVSVMLLDEDEMHLRILSAVGGEFVPKTTLSLGTGIAGHVLQSRKAEIINDVSDDPRYKVGKIPISSMMCAPLRSADKVLGVLNLSSREPVQYTSRDLRLLTSLASQAASAIETALLHEKRVQQELIKSNLARYIAPQLLDTVLNASEDISLNSEKRRITVLFSDIRNFTSTCETLRPEEVVAYLNEYFTHMVEKIFAHDGTVNKFVGDMIVALFGAPSGLPENEAQAIRAAISMQESMRDIPNKWIRDNFTMGIGINTGDVVVGNIGSPKHMDYTAIGDDVNIASRLQSLARGGQVLVSRSVFEAVEKDFEFKEMGNLNVKGRKESVEVFEVMF